MNRPIYVVENLISKLKSKISDAALFNVLEIILEKIEDEFSDFYLDLIVYFSFPNNVLERCDGDFFDVIFTAKNQSSDQKKYGKCLVSLISQEYDLQEVLFEVILTSTKMHNEIVPIAEVSFGKKSEFLKSQLEIISNKLDQKDVILSNIDYLTSSLSLEMINGNIFDTTAVILTMLDHSDEKLVHHLKDILDKFRHLLDQEFSLGYIQASVSVFQKFSEKLVEWREKGDGKVIEDLAISILEYTNFIMTSIPKFEKTPRSHFKSVGVILENCLILLKHHDRYLNLMHLAWAPLESVMKTSRDLYILGTCLEILVSLSGFSKSFFMKRIEPVIFELGNMIERVLGELGSVPLEKFSADAKILKNILSSLPTLIKNLEIQNEELVLKLIKSAQFLKTSKHTPAFLKSSASATLERFRSDTIVITYDNKILKKFSYAHLVWYVEVTKSN